MTSPLNAYTGWLRQQLRWSTSRQAWQERLAVLIILAGTAAWWWLRATLTPARQLVLFGIFFLVLAVLLRRGWLFLFGPVLFYDLTRIARRMRHYVFRTVYALLLLILLGWVYLIWLLDRDLASLRTDEMADFAGSFFYVFMGVQFVVVAVLTPAYVAPAVAEEKERRTLEFILATDLRNREIVLGKLLARLLNLLVVVLAGLPILSAIQFLGGVDPNLVVVGFAVTGLTMLSLAGLSLLHSVLARRSRDAIVMTYLIAVAYLLLSGLSWLFLIPGWQLSDFPSTESWTSPVTVKDLVEWLSVGNPVAVLVQLVIAVDAGNPLGEVLPDMLRDYAFFHGGVAAVCVLLAVTRLRAVARRQAQGATARRKARRWWFVRVGIGERPMLWKEIFAEPGQHWHWLARVAFGLLIVVSFLPPAWMFVNMLDNGELRWASSWRRLADEVNTWVRIVGNIVACLALLSVVVRAAGAISGERDRQTLDGLLTSPLSLRQILLAKWLGSILGPRWAWPWLGVMAVVGVVTGGLHVLAVPVLLLAWLVYAAALSAVGLWRSTASRTTLRATVSAIVIALMAGVGHWLVTAVCVYLPLAVAGVRGDSVKWFYEFQLGLTPPVVLSFLAFYPGDIRPSYTDPDPLLFTMFSGVGLATWAGVGWLLWRITLRQFAILTGRQPEASVLPGPGHGTSPSALRDGQAGRAGPAAPARGPGTAS